MCLQSCSDVAGKRGGFRFTCMCRYVYNRIIADRYWFPQDSTFQESSFFNELDNSVTIACLVLLSLTAGIASLILFSTLCSVAHRGIIIKVTQTASILFFVGVGAYIPYALFASQETGSRFEFSVASYLNNYSRTVSRNCSDASLDPWVRLNISAHNASCPGYNGPIRDRCTIFASLNLFSRLFGFTYESCVNFCCLPILLPYLFIELVVVCIVSFVLRLLRSKEPNRPQAWSEHYFASIHAFTQVHETTPFHVGLSANDFSHEFSSSSCDGDFWNSILRGHLNGHHITILPRKYTVELCYEYLVRGEL